MPTPATRAIAFIIRISRFSIVFQHLRVHPRTRKERHG
jgi:hypothetical protein